MVVVVVGLSVVVGAGGGCVGDWCNCSCCCDGGSESEGNVGDVARGKKVMNKRRLFE